MAAVGKQYIDWEPPDPHGQPLDQVRDTRKRVRALIDELNTN
jgi:hypothetical protein